jgi:hypothetical protein
MSIKNNHLPLGALAGIFALAMSQTANAQLLVFQPGTISLQPNMANQQVEFEVRNDGGSTDVYALELSIRVGDSTSGPQITGVNLLTGTAFQNNNNNGQFGDPSNQAWQQGWAVEAGSFSPLPHLSPGDNLLATVTFDTTGLTSGTWDLIFDFPGETRYVDGVGETIPMQVSNGQLTVVPEPSEYAAMAALGCLAWAVYSRKTKARQAQAA